MNPVRPPIEGFQEKARVWTLAGDAPFVRCETITVAF
jgi:hypothetical protein